MYALREEEKEKFEEFFNRLSYTLIMESSANLQHLNKESLTSSDNLAIGAATGQIILDKVIDYTESMDRDELIRWFVEVACSFATSSLNRNPQYFLSVMIANKSL